MDSSWLAAATHGRRHCNSQDSQKRWSSITLVSLPIIGLTRRCTERLAIVVPHIDSSFLMTQALAFPSMSRLPSSLHSMKFHPQPATTRHPSSRCLVFLPLLLLFGCSTTDPLAHYDPRGVVSII